MDQKDSNTHTRKLASATELRGSKSGASGGKKGGGKMWISLISMVVVLGLAVGVYFLSDIIKPAEEVGPEATSAPSTTVKVVDRKQADIEKVTLKRADGEEYTILCNATVTGEGESASTTYSYEVEGKPYFKLDQSLAKAIVGYGANMTATRQIEEGTVDFSTYGLDKPALSMTTAYRDGTEVTWLFGNQVPTGSGYYICQKGTQAVFAVYSSAFTTLDYKLNDLYVCQMPMTFADYSVIQNLVIEQRGKDTIELRYKYEDENVLSINALRIAQPILYDANGDRAIEVLTACSTLSVTGYAGEKSELPDAGLEDPRAKIVVTDADGNVLTYTVGNFAGVDSVYVQIDDTDAVYLTSSSAVSFLDNVNVSYLVDQFSNLVNILKVDALEIHVGDEQFDMTITREKALDANGDPVLNANGKEETIDTYSFNGEVTTEDLFKDLYQVVIGPIVSKVSDDFALEGDVVASVTYKLNVEPGEFTVEYITYDDDYYAVRRDGQTIFLIKQKAVNEMITQLESFRDGTFEGL